MSIKKPANVDVDRTQKTDQVAEDTKNLITEELAKKSDEETSTASLKGIEQKIASVGGKLSQLLSDKSLSDVIASDADDGEKSSALLILVSKRLFVAFTILIVIGFSLVLGLNLAGQGDNITLPMVLFCGVLGGFVGIQRRLKDLTIRDLEILAISKVYLCLSPLVGGVLAVVLYILFVSNLLAGELFPTFEAGSLTKKPGELERLGFNSILHQFATAGHSDYAKLMFWCFIAGFSERFVTDVIGKFEGKAVKAVDS